MNKSPKVSILLRNLNESENLKILFDLLNKQTYDNFEVVFLDSGSSDNSVEVAEKFESKYRISINHINKSEFTFGRALNKCIEHSDSPKYVISLSAHCFPVDVNFIKNYVELFQNSHAEIIYGKQSGYKHSRLSEASHLNSWFGSNYGIQLANPFTNNGNCGYDIDIFKKFEFNEELTGCEDIYLASKILSNEGKIIYGNNIEVQHFHKENYKTIYYRYFRESLALNKIYPYNFKKRKFIYLFITESIKDISLKLKSNSFKYRSINKILAYRFVKNLAHLKGFKEKNVSTNDIYNYLKEDSISKNFYNHYFN